MRILSFTAKCSDMFSMDITDTNNYIVNRIRNDYVPSNIGIGGGDYIEMKIDIDTGYIVNWNVIKIEKFIEQYKYVKEQDGEEV